jgi:choline dehydrogenase-like flavoprotein
MPDAPTENFIDAWHSLGVRTPQDPGSGSAAGVFSGPSSLNPSNETRSDARTAHYDAVAGSRPNYHLLTGNAVGSINFVRQKATGVEVRRMVPVSKAAPCADSNGQWLNRKTFEYGYVNAKKEIILAAGAAHTPQILQLSGVGPKGLLYSQEIPVVVDLPGVGQNFQDHPTLYPSYNCESFGLRKEPIVQRYPVADQASAQSHLTSSRMRTHSTPTSLMRKNNSRYTTLVVKDPTPSVKIAGMLLPLILYQTQPKDTNPSSISQHHSLQRTCTYQTPTAQSSQAMKLNASSSAISTILQ